MRAFAITMTLALFGACDDDKPEPARIFPDDWATSFVMVAGCRASPDHDLENVSLWVDRASEALWRKCVDAFPLGGSTCSEVFPEGATFLKPQYLDDRCTDLARFSVAKKEAALTVSGGWHYQEVAVDGASEHVTKDGAVKRCYACHATCTGYDQRCYMDP